MSTALLVLAIAVNVAVLVSCVRQVWRFNVLLPELWRLLESKGRAHRVRELRDEPRTNLPSTKYLYDAGLPNQDSAQTREVLRNNHRQGVARRASI